MNYYKLRLDHPVDQHEKSLETVKDTIISYATQAWAYVQEGTTNPHSHWYIATTTPSRTIRSALRKLGFKGNKCYSLCMLDEQYPIQYLAYMYKEGNDIYYSGLDKQIFEEAFKEDERIKEELALKKQSRKATSVIGKIQAWIELHPKYNSLRTFQFPHQLVPLIVEWLIENNRIVSSKQVENYALTLMVRNSDDALRKFSSKIANRIHWELEN